MPLQVWSDGERPHFLGEMPKYEISTHQRPGEYFTLFVSEGKMSLHLTIDRMSVAIDQHSLETGQFYGFARRHHIPARHDKIAEPHLRQTRFTWLVVKVDLEQYEQVFELDEFYPVDESLDPDYYGRVLGPTTTLEARDPYTYVTPLGSPSTRVENTILGSPISSTYNPLEGPTSTYTAARFRPPEELAEEYRKFRATAVSGAVGSSLAPSEEPGKTSMAQRLRDLIIKR